MADSHYDNAYFDWQRDMGVFGAKVNHVKFEGHVRPEDRVVDFGCGGGFMLARLECREKRGVEINPAARKQAESLGLLVHESADAIPDGWADLLISDNALEHTHHPLEELRRLWAKVKPGGRVVFILPCETLEMRFRKVDVHQHLYSWSPNCAGNLFALAGFEVDKVEPFIHRWPPYYRTIHRLLGERLFQLACRLYGRWQDSWHEVRVFARRPAS